jgi:hypothetical protein
MACLWCASADHASTVSTAQHNAVLVLMASGSLLLPRGSCIGARKPETSILSLSVLIVMTCRLLTSFRLLLLSAPGARQSSSPCPTSPSRTSHLPDASSPWPAFPLVLSPWLRTTLHERHPPPHEWRTDSCSCSSPSVVSGMRRLL